MLSPWLSWAGSFSMTTLPSPSPSSSAPYLTTQAPPLPTSAASRTPLRPSPSITSLLLSTSGPPPTTIPCPSTSFTSTTQMFTKPSIISRTSTPRALVIDFFCTAALEVAASLNLPAYYFFPSGAAGLAALLYFATIHNNTSKNFKDLDIHLDFPGLPPVPARDMPKLMLDRADKEYEGFLNISTHMPKSKGIIVNTFESLEPRAIKAISEDLLVPDGPTPPVYYIGPVITDDSGNGVTAKCLTWLDSQPYGSVVFLCFGSLASFSAAQLKDIAVGLEKSGQRFLWVVRNPPTMDEGSDPDLDALLPKGFLDRTKDRGLVVKSWAPQVAVLSRKSVGGFVTHCGWNSILEAVRAGVPMVAWPLYAEQRLNRVFLVEEMKLALLMEESENGFVNANQVERRVRQLMDSEEGKVLRERALVMKDGAKAAISEGGSSRVALAKLAESWKRG